MTAPGFRRSDFVPPGFAKEVIDTELPPPPQLPPFDVLMRLPGAIAWSFECFQDSTSVAAGAAIGNNTAGAAANFTVPDGMEGLITRLIAGPNMIPSTASGTWNGQLTVNAVSVPGFEFFGRLWATDGMGNWWDDLRVFVPELSLIELRKASDTFGVTPTTIGGRVYGWVWPMRARLDWEALHPESVR